MFSNIPYELQTYNQWVMWKFVTLDNGKKTKVPYHPSGYQANVMDSSTWSDFNTVINTQGFDGIGFVLTYNDPFCFIDLDHTEDPKVIEQQHSIYANFINTYAELSPSGKGLHIVCMATTEKGRKRGNIELYSHSRFMTVTGNVYNKKPIINYQQNIDTLYRALSKEEKQVMVVEQEQTLSDEEIYALCAKSVNGERFVDLYQGRWQQYYSSQSEADHSVINTISTYSRNVEQIKRMFRASALGVRDKAKRENYVNDMIKRSFDNYIPPVDISAMAHNIKQEIAETQNKTRGIPLDLKLMTLPQLFPNEIAEIDQSEPLPDFTKLAFSYSEQSSAVEFESLPDGTVKEIARFIYAQSPRPVKTISMITALAFMSGICGRSYNISGTGLNNYYVLLAPTGIGKEGISKGINKLLGAIAPQQPMATKFLGIGELVSGISLLRYLSEESNCCLTVQGEFGLTMQRMTGKLVSPPMLQLRKILLELYGKSGRGEIMRGSVYADTNKNIKEIEAPAFSLLGESTPETFYDSLNDSLVDEGLISRLNIVECSAIRPPLNKSHSNVTVPPSLQQWVLTLISNALTLNATNTVIDVEIHEEAQRILDEFDKFCDDTINNSADESYRQLWNRGHLKALKISALFAVGDNMYKPLVTVNHVKYAIKFVQDSINTIYGRYARNEIGAGSISEGKQIADVCAIIKRFILNPSSIKYPNPKMQDDYVLPAQDIMRATTSYKSFKSSALPKAEAFRRVMTVLETWGIIEEIKKYDLVEKYNYRGKAFTVINPRFFLKEEYIGLAGE